MMSSNIESNSFFKTFCLVAAGAMFGYTIVKGRMKREKPDEKHFNPNRLFKIEDRTSVLKYIRYKLKSFPPSYERKFIRIQEKEALSSQPAIKDGETEIRVMSWNILARGLCQPDETWRAPKDAYDWPNYRLWRTLEETIRFASDIICLEEADAYEEIKPYLHALGYTSIFCPKYRSPCLEQAENIGPDGCAIFYRLDKFRIVNMSCENFKDDSMNSQVYILLQLEHRKLGKRLTVVCLHLKACEEYHELRAQQIEYLLPKLKRHILDDSVNREADLRKHALIICGDFNGGPEEKFYETVVSDTGFGQLVDSYSTRGDKQPTYYAVRQIGDGEKTSIVREEKKLDFMFFTKENLELTEILELPPSDEPLIVEHGLPNLKCSSDHLSIVSSFKFL